jgi:hypothetical protein
LAAFNFKVPKALQGEIKNSVAETNPLKNYKIALLKKSLTKNEGKMEFFPLLVFAVKVFAF